MSFLELSAIYISFLIAALIIIFVKKRSNTSIKNYVIINGIETILGVIIYWIFLDKAKIIF